MYVCIVVQRIRRASSTGAARSLPKNPKVNLAYRRPRNVYITRVSTSRVHVYTYITYLRLDLHIYIIYIRIYSTCVTCRRPPVQTGFSRSRRWSRVTEAASVASGPLTFSQFVLHYCSFVRCICNKNSVTCNVT